MLVWFSLVGKGLIVIIKIMACEKGLGLFVHLQHTDWKKKGQERQHHNGSWTYECFGNPERKKRVISGSVFVTDYSLVSDDGVKKSIEEV